MTAAPSGDTTILSAPFFFGVAADAPPVGDTRVLSILFFLYVFLFSTGVLQIAASFNRMRGLAFFNNAKAGYAFGALFIVCGNLMFFLSGDRNVIAPRLEGTQLLGWTFLGLICSLVVTLAILGWAICPVFGPFAWAMGNSDLRAMRTGQMDPEGQSLTQAGMVLGIIQTILIVIVMFFVCMGSFT